MSHDLDEALTNLSIDVSADAKSNSGLSFPKSSPGTASSPSYRTPLSPGQHPQIQPDFQARVLAFQNKRIGQSSNNVSRSSSLHDTRRSAQNTPTQALGQNFSSPTTSPDIGNTSYFNELSGVPSSAPQSAPPDKPLPPLPPLNSTNPVNLPPIMKHNEEGHFSIPPISSMPLLSTSSTSSIELKKKPSLSERRGMKLNVSELSSMSLPVSTEASLDKPEEKPAQDGLQNTVPRTTGIELSRRFSERTKKKPNFKLDLNNSETNKTSETPNNNPPGDKPKLPGMFANYSKYIDIKKGELKFSGKASLHSKGVDFSSGHSFRISMDELEILDELGRGNYGSVLKVIHKPTNVIMAMKEVRLELDETKFTQILMELDILHKCNSPYIVDFYGAFFSEGAVYMCMEYMDGGSLDKIYGKDHGIQDEESLAYITECVIRGLKELKDVHNIIHRDVKPTNILVNTAGKVKLCDFGVSGNLVASLAKTNIGCQSYMAPERIKTTNPNDSSYSVQSDIWSLGLTILEVACGHYPYPPETYDNIFSQLSAIVDGEPPKLDATKFSKEAQMFVKSCVNMNPEARPIYASLLNSPWLVKYRGVKPHVAEYVKQRLHEIELENEKLGISRTNSGKIKFPNLALNAAANSERVTDLLKNKVRQPALHRTRLQRNSGNAFANR